MSIKCIAKTYFLCFIIFNLISCSETYEVGLSDSEYELAMPLVSSKVTMQRLSSLVKGNTTIKFDPNGKTTIFFNGEVLRKNSAAIFPPLPGIEPFVITDRITNVKLLPPDQDVRYSIKKAFFKDTKINFSGETTAKQDVNVKMKILELSKNGKIFEKDFIIKYNNENLTKFQTEDILIDGWVIQTQDNSMTFQYEATTTDGTQITLDKAFMNFDLIKFSYLEGYLGYHDFKIDGNIIDVGLFNNWESGAFDFENPKITLSVVNAFGLPVRSKVNKMELTSITGKTVNLQSPFVTSGIDFLYPSFNEIGQTKTTFFDFNKDNSNIREVFNEKTKTISYDISALINPTRDTSQRGFITDQSFFVVNVAAEVPLYGSVNELVVRDTLEVELDKVENVSEAELKIIVSNDFPATVIAQGHFLDDSGNVIDKLFDGEGFELSPAALGPNDKTITPIAKTTFKKLNQEQYARISKATKLAIFGYLNTTDSDKSRSLWIYDTYGIDLKIGAKLKIKKD
jgi:hypothetical protein